MKKKSFGQFWKVTENILSFYENYDVPSLSPVRKAFLDGFFRNRIRLMAKGYLMDMPRENFDPEVFRGVDASLQRHMERLGLERIRLFPANKVIRIDAYRYWLRHGSRLPAWLEAVNSAADKIMQTLYTKIFR